MTGEAVPDNLLELPVLNTFLTSSLVKISSSMGLGPSLSLYTELLWVNTNLSPFIPVPMLR